MKRDQLEKICTEPFFAKFISRSYIPDPSDDQYELELPGLFCRIYIGDRKTSSGKSEAIYRICEMIGVQDYPRSYLLTDKRTTVNIGILITHGLSKRLFKIVLTSNSPFTEKEFIQWKSTMNKDGVPLPTKDELSESFLNAMKMHKNFRYDKSQIDILKKNKSKNYNARNLANPHKEKLKISTLIQSLDENDSEQSRERHRLVIYLNDINKEIERRQSVRSQSLKVSIAY